MAKRSRSGLKRKRQSAKRRLRNLSVRSRLKTFAKTALQTSEQLTGALAAFDKAARKGIIHKNAAARKKSRLMKRLTAGTGKQETKGTG